MPWIDVPCSPKVRTIVMRAIRRNAFGRTSLVYGPPGAGQIGVARAIAKTFLCNNVPDDFCGECSSCRRIDRGVYPDVLEMYPSDDWSKDADKEKGKRKKKEYSVGHMRAVREQAMLMPYEGNLKVFLIHDAHCMNESSANSLLKILEEPHPHMRFVLVSDRASAILPTIRSRCWFIRLVPQEIEALSGMLQPNLSAGKARTIARAAGGLAEKAFQLVEEDYLSQRDDLIEALLRIRASESAIIPVTEEIVKRKNDLPFLLEILMRIVRDGLVYVSGDGVTIWENPDRCDDLGRLWQGSQPDGLMDCMNAILDCHDDLERFINPTILMMDLFIRLRQAMVS